MFDRNNFHLFTPLLYQVASSLLDPSDIAYPVRTVFRKARNVRFRAVEVADIDLESRRLVAGDGLHYGYDYLVLATGSTTNFFGNDTLESAAFGLKDLPEALELRNHILGCFEAASREDDVDRRRAWLTFVVVGGGPTGVEYAGALAELVRLVLAQDFPELDMKEVDIQLLEALDRILIAFDEELAAGAVRQLERRGVSVRTAAPVESATEEEVRLATGESVAARTLVWAAGVRVDGLPARMAAERTPQGRLRVDARLRVAGDPRVMAIGDAAACVQDGVELPMLSPPAMQQGRYAARAILDHLRGETTPLFRYRDKGIMATIGRNAGVAQIGWLKVGGLVGWWTWLFVHIYYLIGYRNRAAVLLRWAWEYVFYDRPVRIITRAKER